MSRLTCPDCDWTDEATGDKVTDNMLVTAHRAEHDEPRKAHTDADWYGSD